MYQRFPFCTFSAPNLAVNLRWISSPATTQSITAIRKKPHSANIAMLLVAIFFVSGADAASIVMGTLSQRGTIHPTRSVVIF